MGGLTRRVVARQFYNIRILTEDTSVRSHNLTKAILWQLPI